MIWAASQGHTNVVQSLLVKGAMITKKDTNGKTALAHAAIQEHFSTAKVLKKFGADLNQDLLFASRRGYNKMVNFLINEKADIDYISAKSETALTLAIQEQQIETVRILLEHGANTSVQNSKEQTPLMIAVLTGETKIVKLIFQHQNKNSTSVKIDTTDFIGNTPLMISAEKGFLEIATLLIENGANVESINRWNETALMFASSKGFREIVSLLLEHGAEIDARDISEKTALLRASQNGHLLTVEMLLLKGASQQLKGVHFERLLVEQFFQKYL